MISDKVLNFEKEELKQLLSFIPYDSVFIFDGEYFTKMNDVAIRSPMGPILTFAHILFIYFCVVAATQLIIVKFNDTVLYECRSGNHYTDTEMG